jgi:hypothetical protein
MYRPDGSRTKGLTSSVTAAMRSPKVVLITFRWLLDIDIAPFGLVVLVKCRQGKLCARSGHLRKISIHGQNEKRFRFYTLGFGGL